ncbi:MAG TPA: S-methyl-5'-thioadenosine phosphorylase [Chthonomonadaceae bacterium]|nr:S-methyl-5'-thioadenosine phosphorylase [Chthonomonadaceae bacterium]
MTVSDQPAADIGVFGGSGFYSLLENVQEIKVDTPYGPPSDSVFLAEMEGKRIAFLPRHGRTHTIPPHAINYRANVWAMKSLGVRYLISPCAAGSLQLHVQPEHFVVCDQYVDRTNGRKDTFYDGPTVYHLSTAEPYCPHLRRLAIEVIREHGITVHERGTIVIVQGPRLSTRSESRWYMQAGWEVISMTQYPESYLALEQEIAVVNISLITDYDSGLMGENGIRPSTSQEILHVFQKNSERIKQVVLDLIRRIPLDLDSPCHHALEHAKI